jgi:lipopolysaccharide assembly protein A
VRIFVWLLRAFIFFALFAFALNNQQEAAIRWFFGHEWRAPMVIIVLVAFATGCAIGVLAMVPAWWRHRRVAARERATGESVPAPAPIELSNSQLPSDLGTQHPPRDGV